MKPVASGQWTDIVKDHEIEFEVRRVDRIDVEFQQGAVTEISRATGPDNVHVQVPRRLRKWLRQFGSSDVTTWDHDLGSTTGKQMSVTFSCRSAFTRAV